MTYRILLADDHTLFRQAMRMCLERYPDLEVVAEVADGDAVIAAAKQYAPDVICMDFRMPRLNGAQATRQLLSACPNVKVICLSAHLDLPSAAMMIQAGALALVDKVQAATELHIAIHKVCQNQLYFSPRSGILDAADLAPYLCQLGESN